MSKVPWQELLGQLRDMDLADELAAEGAASQAEPSPNGKGQPEPTQGTPEPVGKEKPKPTRRKPAPALQAPPEPTEGDGAKPPPFTDLRPYLDGTARQERPTVGTLWGKAGLFYRGRLNAIHGEPESGKSNVLFVAAISELEQGNVVLWIDPEDTPGGTVARLLSLGADPDDVAGGFNYLHNPTPEEITLAHRWAVSAGVADRLALVVLDGMAESMAAEGLDENTAGDVLRHLKNRVRPFQREGGPAVVLADHIARARGKDGPGRDGRGSGAKRGRYDGASYAVETVKRYTPHLREDKEAGLEEVPGVPGFLRLRVAKDRNGGVGVPVGGVAAELHFDPMPGRTWAQWQKPKEGPWEPTAIMGKVVDYLEGNPGAGTVELRGKIRAKAETVDEAVRRLEALGIVVVTSVGKKSEHHLSPNGKELWVQHTAKGEA